MRRFVIKVDKQTAFPTLEVKMLSAGVVSDILIGAVARSAVGEPFYAFFIR